MTACILAALFLLAIVALCAPRRRVARRSWRSFRSRPGGWRNWLKLALTGAE